MIRRLLPAALLALAASAAQAQPVLGDTPACTNGARGPALLVEIAGLKNRLGQLRIELYPDNDEDFLADKKKLIAAGKTFQRTIFAVPVTGRAVGCLAIPAPGRYAVAIIHDRDANRKFEFRRDGVGFPNNPRLFLGRPPASKAFVTVSEGVTRIAVRLQYYDGFLGVGPVRRPVDDR